MKRVTSLGYGFFITRKGNKEHNVKTKEATGERETEEEENAPVIFVRSSTQHFVPIFHQS